MIIRSSAITDTDKVEKKNAVNLLAEPSKVLYTTDLPLDMDPAVSDMDFC